MSTFVCSLYRVSDWFNSSKTKWKTMLFQISVPYSVYRVANNLKIV